MKKIDKSWVIMLSVFTALGFLIISFLFGAGLIKIPTITKVSPIAEVTKNIPPVDDYKNCMNEGIDKFTKGEYSEAVPLFLKAKELKPRDGEIHYWLFQAYRNTDKKATNKSNVYLEAQNVIALMPGSPQAKHAQDFINSIDSKPRVSAPVPQKRKAVYSPPAQQQQTYVPPPATQQVYVPQQPAQQQNIVYEQSEEDKQKAKEEYLKRIDNIGAAQRNVNEEARQKLRDQEESREKAIQETQRSIQEWTKRGIEEDNRRAAAREKQKIEKQAAEEKQQAEYQRQWEANRQYELEQERLNLERQRVYGPRPVQTVRITY